MKSIARFVAEEVREALPPFLLFFVLFHLIAATKAVVLGAHHLSALRAAGSTVGALIVAKAVLTVAALPFARLSTPRLWLRALWSSILFGVVSLVFRVVEELLPHLLAKEGVGAAWEAMLAEVAWPLFWLLAVWTLVGLYLYCLGSELVRAVGADVVRAALLGRPQGARAPTDPHGRHAS